jgi:AAHS family benzoate transporter-like MFS transporter
MLTKIEISNLKAFGLFEMLFGALFLGYLADVIGRKKTMLIGAIGSFLSCLAVTMFSHNYILYAIFRFLAAGFIHGCIPIGVIYAMEFVGAKYRVKGEILKG